MSLHRERKVAGQGRERKAHTRSLKGLCGCVTACCWLDDWKTLRFQGLAQITRTGGWYGKRQLQVCALWFRAMLSGNT